MGQSLIAQCGLSGSQKLLEGIRAGSLYCGMENVGEGKDTPGSNWIIRTADAPDPRPVWITIWGGATDLAQALWRVKTERSEEAFAAFSRKLRVYAIHDQYDDAGPWIRENCPGGFLHHLLHSFPRNVPRRRY